MKNLLSPALIIAFASMLFINGLQAQCDSTAYYADRYMSEEFISDGQSYRALIFDDQIAEFNTTFFSGARYRIVGFSGFDKDQLIFTLYDEEDNILFTNEQYQNTPYWDFEFNATMTGRIEARLDVMKQTSGCAVLLIGFER